METVRLTFRCIAFAGIITIAVLALYLTAYRFTGVRSVGPGYEYQIYKSEWQANLFDPAAKIESFLRNKKVDTGYGVD